MINVNTTLFQYVWMMIHSVVQISICGHSRMVSFDFSLNLFDRTIYVIFVSSMLTLYLFPNTCSWIMIDICKAVAILTQCLTWGKILKPWHNQQREFTTIRTLISYINLLLFHSTILIFTLIHCNYCCPHSTQKQNWRSVETKANK